MHVPDGILQIIGKGILRVEMIRLALKPITVQCTIDNTT